jgi:hypothetical protein
LAQAIVKASRAGFEPPEGLKASWEKVRLQHVWFVRTKRFLVGKLEFIRENQRSKQEAEKIVEQLASQNKRCS